MERLLARLERRLGRYAIPNLIWYVAGGMGIVWLLSLARPWAIERLVLDLDAVRHGEVWRLVTFLFIPPPSPTIFSPVLWLLLNLYFTIWIGSSLERHWGSFKFNVYYFVGVTATILAALVAGPTSNVWLNYSLLLAFATTFPDETILLFFVLPIRVKWLGVLDAAAMAFGLAFSGWYGRAAIAAALVNYVLFFGDYWRDVRRRHAVSARQRVRRQEFRSSAPVFGERVCALCGAREGDGADIRVCSCEKCEGKPRTLCLEHARHH